MTLHPNRCATFLSRIAMAAALAPAAWAATPLDLRINQLTATGAECTGGGSYYPSTDAQADKVAFTSWCDLVQGKNADGNSELFIQKAGGGGLKQLTHTVGGIGAMEPDLSADGTLIVFASSSDLIAGANGDGNNEIFVIHADGSDLAQLTHTTGGRTSLGFPGNTHPIFDPSGQHIVFSSDRDLVAGGNADGNNDLYVMNADGSGVRQLTFTTGGWGVNQGMLDDSDARIVFDSDRDLVAGQNTDAGSEIFAMNIDGSGLVQLTHSDSSASQYGNSYPRWTPDGQSIFFASDQDLTGGNPSDTDQVFHMSGDGSGIVQVTYCIGGFGAMPWGVAQHGRSIAVESDCDLVPGGNVDRNGEVFLETWKPASFAGAGQSARKPAAPAPGAGGAGARPMRAPKA